MSKLKKAKDMSVENRGGNCFESNGRMFLDIISEKPHLFPMPFLLTIGEPILVHGRPMLTVWPYSQYAHAWIEIGSNLVYDAEQNHIFLKPRYYEVGKIDPLDNRRYSAKDFVNQICNHGTWGPWE